MTQIPNYSPPYVAEGNCLYLLAEDKRGQTRKKLCNFTPFIVQQVTKNDGTLNRCGFAYTEWLRECFLCNKETEKQFIKALHALFEKYRTEFNDGNKSSHGRVAENVSWLRMGFHLFLMFLDHHLSYGNAYVEEMEEQFKEMLYHIAARQSDAIEQDKPTHLFLRKFFALLESGQLYLKDRFECDPARVRQSDFRNGAGSGEDNYGSDTGCTEENLECDSFDRSTLWAAEREIFERNLRAAIANEKVDAQVPADQPHSKPSATHLARDVAYLTANLLGIFDDDDEHDDYYTRMARRGPTLSM